LRELILDLQVVHACTKFMHTCKELKLEKKSAKQDKKQRSSTNFLLFFFFLLRVNLFNRQTLGHRLAIALGSSSTNQERDTHEFLELYTIFFNKDGHHQLV